MTLRTTALLALAAATLIVVSGCSASGTPYTVATVGQSKVAACASIETAMISVFSDLSGRVSELQTDPQAAVAALTHASKLLHKETKKITNADVRAVADTADASMTAYTNYIKKASKHPEKLDPTEFASAALKMQTDLSSVDTFCK